MRDVPRADDMDAFKLRPARQVLKGEVLARGAREVGMDVQIGDQAHRQEHTIGRRRGRIKDEG